MNYGTLLIKNNLIFVEGRETADPVLIGLAVIDSLERENERNKTIFKGVPNANSLVCGACVNS